MYLTGNKCTSVSIVQMPQVKRMSFNVHSKLVKLKAFGATGP